MFVRLRLQSVYQDPEVFVKDDFACGSPEKAGLGIQSSGWSRRDRNVQLRNSGRYGLLRAEQNAAET